MNLARLARFGIAGTAVLLLIAATAGAPRPAYGGASAPARDKVSVSACPGFPAPDSTFANGFPRMDGTEAATEATLWTTSAAGAGGLQAWGAAPQVIQAPLGFTCSASWAVADGGLTVLLAGQDDPCAAVVSAVNSTTPVPFTAAPLGPDGQVLGLGDCLRAGRPVYTITADPTSALLGVDITSSRPPASPDVAPVDRVLAIFSPGGAGPDFDLICPYFPSVLADPQWAAFAQSPYTSPCYLQAGRTTQPINESVVAFYDAPIGSSDSATAGVVLMAGAAAVCTLPAAEWPRCETILANFVADYGASWDPSKAPEASGPNPDEWVQSYTQWDADALAATPQPPAVSNARSWSKVAPRSLVIEGGGIQPRGGWGVYWNR